MKHWRLLTVVLVAVALSVIGVRHVREKRSQQKHVLEKRAQQKREVAYKAALRSYSEVLRPGVTRNEVESYLRAENVRLLCVEYVPATALNLNIMRPPIHTDNHPQN